MSTSTTAAAEDFWVQGNFAPVFDEVTKTDLPVEGAIPPELAGLYVRNGPNPKQGNAGHWFFGDGMLHGVSLRHGKAEWYRNRWVRTPRFDGEPREPMDLRNSLANTNIIEHAGRILALVENALPMEVSRELGTLGFHDFGGRLKTPFTAHPKRCPVTGELHFFGYSVLPPFLTYHVADASGTLVRSLEIPVRAPTMLHDFALTSGHVIIMDLPVVFDMAAAQRGTMPFAWSDDYGARLAILPRGGGVESLRWVDVQPCYVFHVANAYEEPDGGIVLDVAWYKELWRGGPSATSFESAHMRRWTIAPGASEAAEQDFDDRPIEFPRVDERRVGQFHRYAYALDTDSDLGGGRYGTLLKYDLRLGSAVAHDFVESGLPSEFVMIPASPKSGEDEGWLIGYVYNRSRDASDLVILDAQHVAGPPVARVQLPARVPQGFHGNWLPDV